MSLEYSNQALTAKGLFYNKEHTIYVEGKDDVLFWQYLFDKAGISAYIEDVGGAEIKKYIDKILNEDAGFYVACDLDYNEFLDNPINHNKIIFSYGYSIENSMYYYTNLDGIISKLGKKKINPIEYIKDWVNSFTSNLIELIVLDIANFKNNNGIDIMGNNFLRFSTSKKSDTISHEKITTHIDRIRQNFSDEELNKIRKQLLENKKEIWFNIRGHFLTHAIINLIKKIVEREANRKINISLDNLYALSIDCSLYDDRIDIKYMMERIKKIKSA